MAIYSLISNSSALYLNLKGSGAAYAHRDVNLYNSTASVDQQWVIDSFSGVQVIRSQNNTIYGLNYRPSSGECDIQVIRGNETDAEVIFHSQSDGTYKIELAHHAGLYLTANSLRRLATISWETEQSNRNQNWLIYPYADIGPTKQSVFSGTYAGKNLTILSTDASNIKLLNLQGQMNLQTSPYYGLNGGFWSTNTNTLNIAICDGAVVGPGENDGLQNNWCGSGVIYWDGSDFIVKPITPGSTAYADDPSLSKEFLDGGEGTWAQGGFSMLLGLSNWREMAREEQAGDNNPNGVWNIEAMRSAMVIDKVQKKVYLIDCTSTATFTQVRAAIQAWLGITDGNELNSRYSGLLLDGSGSSQLKARQEDGVDKMCLGDGRALHQIIALRNNT